MSSELRRPQAWQTQDPGNRVFLYACPTPADPSIMWGTEVEMAGMRRRLGALNRDSEVILSPMHVLIKAVGCALREHPDFNARVMAGMLRRYERRNVIVAAQVRRTRRAEIFLVQDADRKPLAEIGREVWDWILGAGDLAMKHDPEYRESPVVVQRIFARVNGAFVRFVLRLLNRWELPLGPRDRSLTYSPVLVNYFASRELPQLHFFKPSRYPLESLTMSVTLGGPEKKAVVLGDKVEIRERASLYVRGDHRIADGYQVGRFVKTLQGFLEDPASMETAAAEETAAAPAGTP